MSVGEWLERLERYAATWRPSLLEHTSVDAVEKQDAGFRVVTSSGVWNADTVVIATGYCDIPYVPAISQRLPPAITQVVSSAYRRPEQLPAGGVLIVGASASGVQLAEEIRRSGRAVTLAVGRHARLPRRYRGHDILWWLDRMGTLSRPVDRSANGRHRGPSLQLVGRPDAASLDLRTLHQQGVRIVGRVLDIDRSRVRFGDDLTRTTAAADLKMADVLARIDEHIARTRCAAPARDAVEPTWPLAFDALRALDLKRERIETVMWATGYRRAYPWLHIPVLDEQGDIAHVDGETGVPGLYVLGYNYQRRLNSGFIDGVGADAQVIAERIAGSVRAVRVA
jgi:putative flavoprotein involved in K+ transport